MRAKGVRESVAEEIIRGLGEYADVLEGKGQSAGRFTRRQVRIRLRPASYSAGRVRRVRQRLGASQAIFAGFLGVSANAVKSWEQGVSRPGGAARRLMAEMERDPAYWYKRLREEVVAR